MNIGRRGLLGGMLAVLAAPAIVRVGSLMQLTAKQQLLLPEPLILLRPDSLLPIQQSTRKAIKLWMNSNEFVKAIIMHYEKDLTFVASDARNNYQWKELPVQALGATTPLE